ncbi:MAG: DNA-3-methyladenine glycosylase [Alphaproteobacteria bacterium]|nr:DNA-3-methyladenine glycosylase [Alphaproteobacteria bacterium]
MPPSSRRFASASIAVPRPEFPPSPTPSGKGRGPEVRRLRRGELPGDTVALARFLLGRIVVRELPEGVLSGRIVETEAYLVGDAACHAFRGETPRNRSLFLARGHAYVYIAYGTAFMLNVAGGRKGIGTGVLIRALEPLDGIALMREHRRGARDRDLARGPGRLAAALRIDLRLDGLDLCRPGPLWLGDDGWPGGEIGESTRIGITRDAERVLRFYLRGNRFLSGPTWLNR